MSSNESGLDLKYVHEVRRGTQQRYTQQSVRCPEGINVRALARALMVRDVSKALAIGDKGTPRYASKSGEVLHFSGCRDDQTCADTILFTGLFSGAMTYSFVSSIEDAISAAWKGVSYRRLLRDMMKKLKVAKLPQIPQFSTSVKFDIDSPFVV